MINKEQEKKIREIIKDNVCSGKRNQPLRDKLRKQLKELILLGENKSITLKN